MRTARGPPGSPFVAKLRTGRKACFPTRVSALGLLTHLGRAGGGDAGAGRRWNFKCESVQWRRGPYSSLHSAGSVRPGRALNGVYEIEKLIAQGGMGEVYRGFNIQTRDPVAIKMIRPELIAQSRRVRAVPARGLDPSQSPARGDRALFRVFRRPRLAARLSRDGIRRRAVADQAARLRAAAARRGQRSCSKRIGGALEAAHRLGVVHRDISPDNIILPDGDVRRPRSSISASRVRLRLGENTIIGSGFRRQIQLRLARAARPRRRRSHVQVGHLQFRPRARRGAARAAARHERLASRRHREAPRRSRSFRTSTRRSDRFIQAMLQPLPANRPAEHGGGGGMGRKRARDRRPPGKPRGRRGARPQLRGRALGRRPRRAHRGREPRGCRIRLPRRSCAMEWVARRAAPRRAAAAGRGVQARSCDGGATGARSRCSERACPAAGRGERKSAADSDSAAPETPAPQQPSPPAPFPPAQHIPTTEELVASAPPRAPQALVELPPATIAAPYRAELPAFSDRSGQGLRLAADGLPPGLALEDLGDGKGVIQGSPAKAGSVTTQIVATNHAGKTAQMTAMLVVADRPVSPLPPSSPSRRPSRISERRLPPLLRLPRRQKRVPKRRSRRTRTRLCRLPLRLRSTRRASKRRQGRRTGSASSSRDTTAATASS